MANGSTQGVKLKWIQDYHSNDKGPSGPVELAGNCYRCGRSLPSHEAQMDHNMKAHL